MLNEWSVVVQLNSYRTKELQNSRFPAKVTQEESKCGRSRWHDNLIRSYIHIARRKIV